jgi:hypothetical protein
VGVMSMSTQPLVLQKLLLNNLLGNVKFVKIFAK